MEAAPESLLSGLSDFLAVHLGLHFPRERWSDVQRGIAAAARDFGFGETDACIRWLLATPPTRSEVEILAHHLTVGETYFFRERRSFEVLQADILPELLHARRGGEQHLRIWSAACCTGEEPYSIAMVLDRLIPDPQTWNVNLLATDINPGFLRKAAEGVYSEWSLRATPPWIRERYFRRVSNKRFEILPTIRSQVTFSYLNLAADLYPSLINNTNAMDVIFCRNVLIYFTAAQVKKVIDNLYRSLVDGGWLIVSPTEASATLFSCFTAAEFPGVMIYRKLAGASRRIMVPGYPAPAAEAGLPASSVNTFVSEVTHATLPQNAQPEATPRLPDPDALGCAARTCANEGRLSEAVEWCERAIAANKLNPAHHYLLATIQQERGHSEAVVQSLRRALYLDPNFVLAYFALANLRLAQGQRPEAERHFEVARTLLQTQSAEEILPESEGLTAGRLGEIITSILSSLAPAVAAG